MRTIFMAIYLVDDDPDHSQSVFKQIVTSKKDAFSRPTLVCNLIDDIPEDKTIKIVINTCGGQLHHCEKILKKLLKRKNGYVVYIRGECYSAGAIIALGDPQNGAGSKPQLTILANLDKEYIDSRSIYDVTSARYVMNYTLHLLNLIYNGDSDGDSNVIPQSVRDNLLYSKLPHCALFDYEACQSMGLQVRRPRDDEVDFFDTKVTVSDYQQQSSTNQSMWTMLYNILVPIGLGLLTYKSLGALHGLTKNLFKTIPPTGYGL
jgi:hypothetical protein